MKSTKIHEVGPRDGLQSESVTVPLEVRIQWIEGLLSTGIDIIQLGSFVNPKRVPQMAETEALFKHFTQPRKKPEGVTLSALVLNSKGLDRGLDVGVEMFCMGVSASRTHSLKNTGMTPGEAQRDVLAMARRALLSGKRVQASVQSAFGCGYEGPISSEVVLDLVKAYLNVGVRCISLADTAGHAIPPQVEDLFGAIRMMDPAVDLACHFHNTYGLGLANCLTAVKNGVSYFESSFAGLGGCPFTRVAAGNVSTEDLVHTLQRLGRRLDIDLNAILKVSRQVAAFFDRDLPSMILQAGSIVDFKGMPSEELQRETA
jgi:hydroxymethylglutaryl-CoA lyase